MTEKFAVIIPDRGDREELTKFCFQQISRMTKKPDQVFHIDHKPISNDFDLVERVYSGICLAKDAGFDVVFIIENDDFFPDYYFNQFGDFNADIFGDDLTFYYNLKHRSFQSFYHQGRSSLFTTGFRISKMQGFQWTGNQFLDIRLWKWANEKGLSTRFVHTGAIGMKHGTGLCGGKGHKMQLKNTDTNMNWLRGRVDRDAYLFYTDMSRKLWEKELV
jgi:hypothetical protein